MSYFSQLKLSTDNAAGDAFGRLRTSLPVSLFDGQLTYDLQPLLFEQVTAEANATVTHDATNRNAIMTFAATPTGGKAEMQTFEHFRYRAGHSHLAYITFNMNGGVADVLKYAGYSDGNNGIEFQLNGLTPQFAILSDTDNGDQIITQANWNIDTLDGSGPSGVTLDVTKTQILVIDFQALYVGRVRVGFDLSGVVMWAHEFDHANIDAFPYIQTANLPVRCGMTCTATVSTTMNFICCTVQTESSGEATEGFQFTKDATVTAASGAPTHLVSIQPKTVFNAITNRTKIVIDSVTLLVTGTNPVKWTLCLDALLGTPTFTDVNGTYSAMGFNTAATADTPAIILATGFISASAQVKGSSSNEVDSKYPITLDVAGAVRPLGTVTLLVEGIGGTSAVLGAINWTEIR